MMSLKFNSQIAWGLSVRGLHVLPCLGGIPLGTLISSINLTYIISQIAAGQNPGSISGGAISTFAPVLERTDFPTYSNKAIKSTTTQKIKVNLSSAFNPFFNVQDKQEDLIRAMIQVWNNCLRWRSCNGIHPEEHANSTTNGLIWLHDHQQDLGAGHRARRRTTWTSCW